MAKVFRSKQEAEGFKILAEIDPIAAEKSMAAHIASIHPTGRKCRMCGAPVKVEVNRPRMGGRIEYYTCEVCGYSETSSGGWGGPTGHNAYNATLVKCRDCGNVMTVVHDERLRYGGAYYYVPVKEACRCHNIGGQGVRLSDGRIFDAIENTSVIVLERGKKCEG